MYREFIAAAAATAVVQLLGIFCCWALPCSTCHMHHACPASPFHAPFDLIVVSMDTASFASAAGDCAPARCCDGCLKQHMACATCSACTAPPVPDVCEQALLHLLKREVSSVLKVSSWCIIRCKRSGCWILSKYQP